MSRPKPLELLAQCPVWDALDGGTLVVACSGGRDSVALALAAHELLGDARFCERFSTPPLLVLWHLDHGLRASSAADARFVERLAVRLKAPCRVEQANLSKLTTRTAGWEAPARHERYLRLEQFLDKLEARQILGLDGPARAMTAHHLSDQAETVLHHILRGTDLAGLRGIAPVLRKRIFRPWLELPAGEIAAYVKQQRQSFRQDPTNRDTRQTRNRIRLVVMPLLREINSAAEAHLARLAELARRYSSRFHAQLECHERAELASNQLAARLPLLSKPAGIFGAFWFPAGWRETELLAELILQHMSQLGCKVDYAVAHQAYHWAARRDYPLDFTKLRYWMPSPRLLTFSSVTAELTPPFSQALADDATSGIHMLTAELRRGDAKDLLAWLKNFAARLLHIDDFMNWLTGEIREPARDRQWRCYLPDVVALPLTLRTWREGDRIELAGGGTKKLGDIFTDAKVPTCFRPAWAVLTDANDKVLWVPALADSATMQLVVGQSPRYVVILRASG